MPARTDGPGPGGAVGDPGSPARTGPDWADRVEPMPPTDAASARWKAWTRQTLPELIRSAREAGWRSALDGRWLTDTTMAAAERLRFRDHRTLTTHHRGRPDNEIARLLVRNASLATAAIGAATGGLVTLKQAAPPAWLSIPFVLAAETAIVVGVELKLTAELNGLADRPIDAGGPAERGMLLVGSWAEKRGVSATVLLGGGDLMSRQARDSFTRMLRTRLTGRMGRNLSTMIPLMAGAAAGAEINRRTTRGLGEDLARDLGFSRAGVTGS